MRLALLAIVVVTGSAFAACSSSTPSSSSSSSTSSSGSSGTDSGTSGSSGDSGTSGCVNYMPPSTFDATTPVVSFANDVMPVFGMSCAFTTCHGNTTGNSNGVFLGQGDATKVHDGLVGMTGNEETTMPFVTAGDPENSYLMRKMDASQCALNSQCSGSTCQDSMPQEEDSLPVETRDIVRRWIAQGANNN